MEKDLPKIISDLKLSMQKYKEIKVTDTLNKALSLFTESNDILIVLDDNNEYSGILTELKILQNFLDPEKTKIKNFKINVPKVEPTTEISECARLMVENNIMSLPVFEKGKLSRIISYIDLFQLPAFKKIERTMISELITKPEVTITPDESMSIAINKFKKHNLFSIPVVEKEQLIGMLSLHDLIHTIIGYKRKPEYGTMVGEKLHLLDLPVENIITTVSATASKQATISNVIEKIIENRLDSLPIIENNNLQGIVAIKDLLKLVITLDELVLLPNVQVNSDIKDLDKEMIQTTLNEFAEQFSSILGECSFDVYIRAHREKQKHKKLIFTRIHIFGHKHKYDASAEAWGEALSFKEALEKLERQVLKEKPSKKYMRNRTK